MPRNPVIKKGRLRQFRHTECKDDVNLNKQCVVMKTSETRQMGWLKKTQKFSSVSTRCTSLKEMQHWETNGKKPTNENGHLDGVCMGRPWNHLHYQTRQLRTHDNQTWQHMCITTKLTPNGTHHCINAKSGAHYVLNTYTIKQHVSDKMRQHCSQSSLRSTQWQNHNTHHRQSKTLFHVHNLHCTTTN